MSTETQAGQQQDPREISAAETLLPTVYSEDAPGQLPAVYSDSLTFPASYLGDSRNAGIGIDIGGSLIKVAYLSPLVEYSGDTARIIMEAYDVSDISLVLSHLVQTLGDRLSPDTVVYTTGVGCNRHAQLIQNTLNTKIKNEMEPVVNAAALKFFIQNFPLRDYVHRPCHQARPHLQQHMASFEPIIELMDWTPNPGEGSPCERQNNIPKATKSAQDNIDVILQDDKQLEEKLTVEGSFPALVCMFGSGSFTNLMYEDGSIIYLDINTSCGRTLMALGSLLAGANSFRELVTLAERGDSSKVDQIVGDMTSSSTEDFFQLFPQNTIMYCYGKAVNKSVDDFRKEDMAAAVVSQMAQQLAQNCHLANMACSDAKVVFFCGNVCDLSELMRIRITEQYGIKTLCRWKDQQFYFLKYGGTIGALGGLIMSSRNQQSSG